ncbi:MAG: hypothetical protein NZ750_12225 [Anaerolineae bacterium]|nr:hypothetical protein [Anaerolineae bacterium]MDW8172119.1 hypothetical protein [Anaerolineae bacterium]
MRQTILLAYLWLALSLVVAQTPPRDYAVEVSPPMRAADGRISIVVTVTNQGGDGVTPTFVRVYDTETETIISQGELPPLPAGQLQRLQFTLNPAEYAPRTRLSLRVEAGLDPFEIKGTPIAENNIQFLDLPLVGGFQPIATSAPATTAQEEVEATPEAASPPLIETTAEGLRFNLLGNAYDFSQQELLIAALAALGVVLILWVLSIIFRLLTRRPPTFPLWQAPYATVPMLDPNSVEGRRQAWQLHAQNGLILAANRDGALHPIKQLISTDGQSLSNWQVTAMRISQYDNYGRVARSQVIARPALVKRFNRLLKRRLKADDAALQRQVMKIARPLVRQVMRSVSNKNAFLPIALDIRWSGRHGEVRILFELYQFQGGAWYRIDQWEPMMAIASRTLQENYTFTIHGMSANENLRSYAKRLQEDLAWLLLETVRVRQPQQQARPSYSVPDTLSGMKPAAL